MVALILTMIWRQVGSVRQLVHLLNTEGLFWAEPTQVSLQAVSERLRTLPAELFQQVLLTLLPQLHTRWQSRQRPLLPEIAWAQAHYTEVLVHDGSTLDALVPKVGLLRTAAHNPLAGRMTALFDSAPACRNRFGMQPRLRHMTSASGRKFWPPSALAAC